MTLPIIDPVYTHNTNTSTSITISEPGSSGTTIGDLVLIFVNNDIDNAVSEQFDDITNKPTGFNLIQYYGLTIGSNNNDCQGAAYYRVIDNTEIWPITCTTASHADLAIHAIRVTGFNEANPIHIIGTSVTASSFNPQVISGLSTLTNDCMIFYTCVSDGEDTLPHTPDVTWTKGNEIGIGGAGGLGTSWGYKPLINTGVSGDTIITTNVGDGMSGVQFAIAPSIPINTFLLNTSTVTFTSGSNYITEYINLSSPFFQFNSLEMSFATKYSISITTSNGIYSGNGLSIWLGGREIGNIMSNGTTVLQGYLGGGKQLELKCITLNDFIGDVDNIFMSEL